MSKKYLIQWKSKINGRMGKGTKLFEQGDAQRLVEELNHEFPQIQHELLEAEAASESAEKPAPANALES